MPGYKGVGANAGAAQLAAKKLSGSKVITALKAAGIDVTAMTVSRWTRGERLPSPEARKAFESALGIPARAWDMAPGWEPAPAAAPARTGAEDLKDLVPTVAAKAQDLLTRIERWRGQAEFDEASAGARAQLATLELKAIEQLAKLTGQSAPPESTLLKSPHWVKLCNELLEVLEAHPDALRAVVKLLERRAAT